mmetsp:Transcript_14595/g.41716  ORF Transcript_14595/g.41716 Transcript_14595/m.41716 type:complete len:566 (+) Transcript_14595:46-1743(+)
MSVLSRLRDEFHQCSGSAGTVSPDTLARRWARLALEEQGGPGCGPLDFPDQQAIALRAAQLLQEMDVKCRGHIGKDEWIHAMLLLRADRAAAQISTSLRYALPRHPRILEDLQRLFERADKAGCGHLGHRQVTEMYGKRLWHLHPTANDGRLLTDHELSVGDPEQFARQLIEAMDVDGDGRISYAEFIAFCIGRRKRQVTLHMYDLSKGSAKALSPWLLGKDLECVWHTGVVVFDHEYFFSSDTIYDLPGQTAFGDPTRVVDLGYTLWSQEELHTFIVHELKPEFHRGTYDIINKNCNHFSERLCMYLTGTYLPEEVLEQSRRLMELMSVRAIRPILNWMLRDCVVTREGEGTGKGVDTSSSSARRLRPGEQLSPGTFVAVHAAWGFGTGIFGLVCEDPEPEHHQAIRWGGNTTSCTHCAFQPLSGCQLPSAREGRPARVWVRYFDLAPGHLTSGFRGQVYTELVPWTQLSAATLDSMKGEPAYHAALSVVATTCGSHVAHKGGASKGWIPLLPAFLPVSAQINDEPLPYESPRLGGKVLRKGRPPQDSCDAALWGTAARRKCSR